MKTAGDIIERYIKKYHDLVDYINDCTDKRIPISQKDDELRNDLSRFWMAAAGNPNSRDGSWEHGKPIIYDAMEEYASQKEQWISVEDRLPKEKQSDKSQVVYHNFKCNKCGFKFRSDDLGQTYLTCTQPAPQRTSGICGGEITIDSTPSQPPESDKGYREKVIEILDNYSEKELLLLTVSDFFTVFNTVPKTDNILEEIKKEEELFGKDKDENKSEKDGEE